MRTLLSRQTLVREHIVGLLVGAILVACILFLSGPDRACLAAETEASQAPEVVTELKLFPAEFRLMGRRSRQQLLLSGMAAAGDPRDLTASTDIVWASSDPAIVRIENQIAIPVADGKATISATLRGETVTAQATVEQMGADDPVSFKTDVLAALTKAGCNMGACHGSPSGKGGFRLSLRGYDPPLDINTLRTEFQARRVNLLDPDASLLLKKPLMEVAHGGGRRLTVGDPAHTALRQWITEGMKLDVSDEPDLQRIEVVPPSRVFVDGGDRQQLQVQGYFSDGSVRDVTALTVFSSSSEAVATVSETGVVKKQGRGETAILARYLDKMSTAPITFLETVPGFHWNDSPERNFVDQLVNAKLKQLQILPSDLCSDDDFLRRATLDLTGRLPTLAEVEAFHNETATDKRAKLIDALLDSSDHAEFWSLKWADVLRTNSGKLKPAGVAKLNRWIYEGVYHDQPMDEFARELLTARGSVFENPAANYWRASRDPSDATETTAQLFLGVRIQCAKCHNHPFERWTQDNYYGIGAAFARVGRKNSLNGDDEVIFVQSGGEVTQPRTGATMKVHLLLQGDVDVAADQDRRQVFADWLTKEDNPFFARSITNRVWGHLFGRGIVEPVDDFRDSNPPSNAPLLDELARQFVQQGYSRKWLIRTIMNSHTYQRSSGTNPFNVADDLYFSHFSPRMLSAEQLLDAICSVTAVPEKFAGVPEGFRATQLPEPPKDHYFLKVFGQPQREMACECERSSESNLSQALQMINGPTVHDKLRSDASRIKKLIDAGKTDEEIVTELYLAGLARRPTTEESAAAKAHLSTTENRRWGLEDIGWAVLNMKEFLFQH
ncbi:MAG: DUF1553 domain-containing protein [Planctomycetaceae bacterium]